MTIRGRSKRFTRVDKEYIIEQGSDEKILVFGKEIRAKAYKIEQTTREVMLPIHDFKLQYNAKSTKEVFKAVKLGDLGEIGISRPFF